MLGLSPSIVHSVNDRVRAQGVDSKSIAISNTSTCDAEISRIVRSKNWNGLFIGYGVRQDQKWYERVLKIVHEANPNLPLIQHNGPSDVENAIERHFNVRLPLGRI